MFEAEKPLQSKQNGILRVKTYTIMKRMYESAIANPANSQKIISLYLYYAKICKKIRTMHSDTLDNTEGNIQELLGPDLVMKILDFLNENEILQTYKILHEAKN